MFSSSSRYLDYKKKVEAILRFFIDIIFPIECLECKQEGDWLCAKCTQSIPINQEPYCLNCKIKTNLGEFCEKCKAQYSLDGVFITSSYDNKLVQQAIKTLKYRFVKDVSRELSKLLILFMQNALTPNPLSQRERGRGDGHFLKDHSPAVLKNFSQAILIPVPLHKKRQRWRGFNQAEALAYYIAEHFNLEVDKSGLQRVRHTRAQAKLGEEERKKNITGSFIWQGEELNNRSIIIIDDVVTTGATLEECAQALKQAGAREVWGLVVAKG